MDNVTSGVKLPAYQMFSLVLMAVFSKSTNHQSVIAQNWHEQA